VDRNQETFYERGIKENTSLFHEYREILSWCDNHYALWLDLRTIEVNTLHGSGKALQNTKDGKQLAIAKTTGKGPCKMLIFIISDALTD
jgi:hypothetical protein